MSEPTREQKCADLARAMGYSAVKDGSYFYLLDLNGDKEEDAEGYPIASTCEEGIWALAPDPFTDHADCHALVVWLATQQRYIQQRFVFAVRDETTDVDLCYELRILTADPAIIAEAAWLAIQEKTKCTN